jgi:uncharacterized coiled-coil protein SlyX
MFNLISSCRDRKARKRIKKLEKRMANEVQDLQALKASVDAHNAADTQFQTDVNTALAALKQTVADDATNTAAIDAAILDVQNAVSAMPTLSLPADPAPPAP